MMRKRLTAGLLCLLMTAGTVSCASEQGRTESQNSGMDTNTEQTTAEVVTGPEGTLMAADFGGETIKWYLWDLNGIEISEETGDIIDDAVYRRNRDVQERYNVNFAYTSSAGHLADWDKWFTTCKTGVMAGDDAMDIVGGYGYYMSAVAIDSEIFFNLNDVEALDFDQPWWAGRMHETASIGGNLYTIVGNVDPGYYGQTQTMVFNKGLAQELNIGDLYALVGDGAWTFDKLVEYSKLSSADLDGDGTYGENDRYGLALEDYAGIDAFNSGFDVKYTEYDADGVPSVPGLTEKITDVITSMCDFVINAPSVYFNLKKMDGDAVNMFAKGNTLFSPKGFSGLHGMRELELDFGILPYPKWDEAQPEYYSANAIHNTTVFAIPITADTERAGCILEAMSCLGYQNVLPEYYERALKGKGVRDDESEEMLDIIFNQFRFDFTYIYSYAFGNVQAPSMMMRIALQKKNKPITSLWTSYEKVFSSTMERLIGSLQ